MGFENLQDVEEDSMRLCCPRKDAADLTRPGSENGVTKDPSAGNNVEKFGYYQMMMFGLLSILFILIGTYTVSYVFTAGVVKYRCLVPECEHPGNTTFEPPWINASAPKINGIISGCERYEVRDDRPGTCTETSFTNRTRDCDSWVYDPDESTILNEWGFTCDANRWKLTLVGTMQNVGQLVCLMFSGFISDRFGRRTLLTLAMFLTGVSGLIQSFSVNYWMFLAFEFLDAVMGGGIYSAGFILAIETVGMKNRILGSIIVCCTFSVGEILLGVLASWLRSWRTLLRVIYAPALLVIFLPLFVPESIRWLMSKGKHDEVEKIYRKIARMNGLEVTDEAINAFKELNVESKDETKSKLVMSDERKPIVQVLHSSVILIRLLACSFCWLTNTFVYYGLSLNSVAFAGDKYINFILVTAVEIPAYCLIWIVDHIGRKPTLCGAYLLSGAFCLATDFIPTGVWSYGPLLLFLGGKVCITLAFGVIYIYTAELFPTTLRHSLLGICSMTGRIGSILAPQTPLLAQIMSSLPLILFGSMGMIAGILSLTFPETLGTKLPDTVWEAERIGKSNETRKISDLNAPGRRRSSVER